MMAERPWEFDPLRLRQISYGGCRLTAELQAVTLDGAGSNPVAHPNRQALGIAAVQRAFNPRTKVRLLQSLPVSAGIAPSVERDVEAVEEWSRIPLPAPDQSAFGRL